MSRLIEKVASNVLRDNHYVLNPVSSLYERSLLIEKVHERFVQNNIPGAARSSFKTVLLSPYKANLAQEYALRIDSGDVYTATMPANFTPDAWSIVCCFIPDWSGDDNIEHTIFRIERNNSNYIVLLKNAAGNYVIKIKAGGTDFTKDLSATDTSPGVPVWLAVRLAGGSATIYRDDENAGFLTSQTVNSVASLGSGVWTLYVGQGGSNNTVSAGANSLRGAINLQITNDSSATPITDRYASGAGLGLASWLHAWHANLVMHVGGDATTPRLSSYQGATNPLVGSAEGRYRSTTGVGGRGIDFGNRTEFDAATKFWLLLEMESLGNASTAQIIGRWNTSDNTLKQWRLTQANGGAVNLVIATDLAGGTFEALTGSGVWANGERVLLLVRVDLGGATDADRIKIDYADFNSTTKKYGAWASASLTFTGIAPATLVTAGGNVSMMMGRTSDSQNFVGDAYFDDFRWTVGATLTNSQRDAIIVNEADPSLTQHWYPFDGNANDAIGSVNGTVTGYTQADDGRHHYGNFDRFVKQGQVFLDGIDDQIDHGDYAAMNAATQVVVEHIYTPGPITGSSVTLWRRGNFTGACHIRARLEGASGRLRVYVAPDLADSNTSGLWDSFFTEGVPTRYRVEFDGTLVGDANRLKVYKSTFDKSLGQWSALAQVAASSFSGTIPAALTDISGSGTAARAVILGALNSNQNSQGLTDRLAIHAGSLPPAFTPYQNGAASYGIWCDYNGNANNAGTTGAANNGTVSGAIQWYDGRQPEGWTLPSNPTTGWQIDRAAGANEAQRGTFGLRLLGDDADRDFIRATTTATVIAGDLAFMAGYARKGSGAADQGMMEMQAGGFPETPITIPVQATQTIVGTFLRATSSAAGSQWRIEARNQRHIWVDTVAATAFAPIAAATATKGAAVPGLDGFGYAFGVTSASIVTPTAESVLDVFNADLSAGQGQKIIKLDTGPNGNKVRRYRFGLGTAMNGLTANLWYSMSVMVFLKTASTITPANVILRCVDSVGTSTGTAMTAKNEWQTLYATRKLDAAATFAYFELLVESDVAFGTSNDALYIALPTIVSGKVRPAPLHNDTELITPNKAGDLLYFPFVSAMLQMTGYYKIVLLSEEAAQFIFHIGSATPSGDPRLDLYRTGGLFRLTFDNGTTEVHSTATESPVLGEQVEFLAHFYSDGKVQLTQVRNEGTPDVATISGVNTIQPAWAGSPVSRLYLGSDGVGNFTNMAVLRTLWQPGVKDLDTMRALAVAP